MIGLAAMKRRMGERLAFTLVELLVVIAIIAVLAGILLPGLKSAREQVKIISCKSNQRQLSVGAFLYSSDWRGYPPYIGTPFDGDNYMPGFYGYVVSQDWPSNKFIPVFNCPNNRFQWCTGNKPPNNRNYSVYGLNAPFGGYDGSASKDYCGFTHLKRPSITPLFGDCGGGSSGSFMWSDSVNGSETGYRIHIFRHKAYLGAGVFSRCDGHVDSVNYPDAYTGSYPLSDIKTWRPRNF